MSIFSEKLMELIEENNLTLKEYAKLSGISRSSLSHWTRFNIIPNTHSIIKIAKSFDCPVDFLIGRAERTKAIFSESPVTFSERLKNLIASKNITPYRVCIELHIDTAMMTDWMNNGTLPAFDNLILLTDYFNCSADYLLGLNEQRY